MKRINYVDFIKGMAIIAMAFGHIMYFEQLHPLLLVKLFFAYTWHVGVFFIIGGFFLKNVNMSNIKAFIKKKPNNCICWHCILYMLQSMKIRIEKTS